MKPSDNSFFEDVLDHNTHYYKVGKGKPVILLHGSGPGVSAYQNWGGLIPELGQKYQVIAPDIAGFGETELRGDAKYGIKFWVAHLTGLMDKLGIEKAYMVGNSFGGALSIGMAIWQPTRVEKIFLMGTPAGDFKITDGLRAGREYEPSYEGMKKVLSNFPFDPTIITEEMIRERYEASNKPGTHEALRKLMPPPKDGADSIVKAFPAALIQRIKCPVTVVHGKQDKVVPPACGQLIFDTLPQADLHMFGNCGHWVQKERKQDFMQLLDMVIMNDAPKKGLKQSGATHDKEEIVLNRLEHIVYDLGVKRDARNLFKENPAKLFKKYGLSGEEARMVKEFDVLKMAKVGVNSMAMMGYWASNEPSRSMGNYVKKLNGKL